MLLGLLFINGVFLVAFFSHHKFFYDIVILFISTYGLRRIISLLFIGTFFMGLNCSHTLK